MIDFRFVEKFIGFLEKLEYDLISWGFYDSSFSISEIQNILEKENYEEINSDWVRSKEEGYELEDLFSDLESNKLIYKISSFKNSNHEDHYRTRFGEGLRLIYRLKQRFKDNDWDSAPNLVSDIKCHLTTRKYPKFDQDFESCWLDLSPLCKNKNIQEKVFRALSSKTTARSSEPIKFAGFQRRAFNQILKNYNKNKSGTVICAGTGSGKTKSFYIPAFLSVIGDLISDPSPYTKIIAVYPRNVLLADQLREALSEILKINESIKNENLRSITIGAFLGDVPNDEKSKSIDKKKQWKQTPEGYVVPFIKSPRDSISSLIWKDEDRENGRTVLYRENQSTPDVPNGIISLTRDQIKKTPPDILFLSAEMLNRELGNPEYAKLFGVGNQVVQSPRLLLLDEVHSYERIQGAHLAWLLRRWLHWSKTKNIQIVGLSATLKNPQMHLSRVTGFREDQIKEIRPDEEEFIREGTEYSIAIKGDASSGAALLSTSIQVAMVLTRLLHPRHHPRGDVSNCFDPDKLYGRKVFGFTDKLDVINRWLPNLKDAEKNLPGLRKHPRDSGIQCSAQELKNRDWAGQIWEFLSKIDSDQLDAPLVVTRCSSQDPGVEANSDLIVATQSLEVGFDDPNVGAVIQHKAPRTMASFLQRKGRAGRTRGHRPFTAVVLSDYGVDRGVFQNAERIFEPEIDSLLLPLKNPYVVKIQATYFLIEYLGLKTINAGGPFRYLTASFYKCNRKQLNLVKKAQEQIIGIIKDMLIQGNEWHKFRFELSKFFKNLNSLGELKEEDLDKIFWHPPRALMMEVLPTLLRKLESEWDNKQTEPNYIKNFQSLTTSQITNIVAKDLGIQGLSSLNKQDLINEIFQRVINWPKEDDGTNSPLPQFLPSTTFSEINEIGIQIITPNSETEFMPPMQGLREVCPGKVSRRYAKKEKDLGLWLKKSKDLLEDGEKIYDVLSLFPNSLQIDSLDGMPVFQPTVITLENKPDSGPEKVKDSSNAFWKWEVDIKPKGEAIDLLLHKNSFCSSIFKSSKAYLHRDNSELAVIRYSSEGSYEITLNKKNPKSGIFRLGRDERGFQSQAVGFRQCVDGLIFEVDSDHFFKNFHIDANMEKRFRSDYFLYRMNKSDVLSAQMNTFKIKYLWQTSISMLSATCARSKNIKTLEQAQADLNGLRKDSAEKVLNQILQGSDEDLNQEDQGSVTKSILEFWEDPEIIECIKNLEELLWRPLDDLQKDEDFNNWCFGRYVSTIAKAMRFSLISRLKELSEEDFEIDIKENEIYITEKTAGGLGQIEVIVDQILKQPNDLGYDLVNTIKNCKRQKLYSDIFDALVLSMDIDDPMAGSFETIRRAVSVEETEKGKDQLILSLKNSGISHSRSLMVSLISKILMPGSSSITDKFIYFLNQAHKKYENKIKISFDERVFSYICLKKELVKKRLKKILRQRGYEPQSLQLYNSLNRFFLQNCEDSCPDCLSEPYEFQEAPEPSRDLVMKVLDLKIESIKILDNFEENLNQIIQVLVKKGIAGVSVEIDKKPLLADLVKNILAVDIPINDLFESVVLCGVESQRSEFHAYLRILNHEKQENNDRTSVIDTSNLSKDIWSKSGSDVIREILMSAISSLFLSGKKQQPLYLISPWLSDFVLFKNYSQEFSSFFPKFNDKPEILFSECLGTLAELLPIRIMTTKNKTSDPFVSKLRENWSDIEVRNPPPTEHKKGLLSPNFYIEGSMNFTYSGVFIRDEIISYHTDKTVGGNQKISIAYIEYQNQWDNMEN